MEAETPCVELVYQRLVQLVSRAFYKLEMKQLFPEEEPPDTVPVPKSKSKKMPADFTGLGIVIMEALLNRPWWEEEEFARKLQLPMRPVRQVLRLLETHFLVAREHRKEKKPRKGQAAAAKPDAAVEGDVVEEGNPDSGHLISYCSLDYQRIFDMARLRLYKMRQTLKSELEDRRAVQEYVCPTCSRMYTTLHAAVLIKSDGLFHCEECDTVLESGGMDGQAETTSRRERVKLVKAKQAKMEQELAPLTSVLTDIEKKISSGDFIPDFGTLTAWASTEAQRIGGLGAQRTGRQSEAAQINIKMDGGEIRAAAGAEVAPRELPPWLQRQNGATASTSHSLSHELSEDTKDFHDVKSLGPEESKAAMEAEYMRQYKERMANIASQESQPNVKRQKTEGGWEEVGVKTESGWTEVSNPSNVKEEDDWEDAETGERTDIKSQEPEPGPSLGHTAAGNEEDEDWEDA